MKQIDPQARLQPPIPRHYRLPPVVHPNWRLSDLLTLSSSDPENLSARLCERYGVKHCLLLDRARSGLYLLCKAFGLDGEWITSPLMHRPTIVLLHRHSKGIVLADVDDDFCISPEGVEASLSPATCAILATHLYGKSADLIGLRQVADRHGILLIENAVHMAGGFDIQGRRIGSWGDAALLSFNVDKPLGGILGGALLTNRDDIWDAVQGHIHGSNRIRVPIERIMRTYLAYRLKPYVIRSPLGKPYHGAVDGVAEIESFSTRNYSRYTPRKPHLLQAAIALRCSQREEYIVERRLKNAGVLGERLRSVEQIHLPVDTKTRPHCFTYFPIVFDHHDRWEIGRRLASEGIETKWRYAPIHLQAGFSSLRRQDLSNAERLWASHLLVPLGPGVTEQQIEILAGAISRAISQEQSAVLDAGR